MTQPRISYSLHKLKRRFGCQHPGSIVTADIMQGGLGGADTQIQWCRRCGAYRFVFDAFGRRPREDDWRIPSRWTAG